MALYRYIQIYTDIQEKSDEHNRFLYSATSPL